MVLGGAFFVNGNVNPAAEANIFGDAEAADLVLGLCPRCRIVGLDVTHQVSPILSSCYALATWVRRRVFGVVTAATMLA